MGPTEYYSLARLAERAGLITDQEIKLIARPNTRKQNYWARHVYDLKVVLWKRVQDADGPLVEQIKEKISDVGNGEEQ
jgi:hypothetical protein